MKRAAATCLATALLLGAPTVLLAQLLGDADGNGIVNDTDAQAIANFAFGMGGAINVGNADVNKDGLVDMRDALAIGQAGIAPLILFTSPSFNEQVVNDSTVTLKGVVLVHALLSVSAFTINGTAVALNNGAFSHQVDLAGGLNTFTASATEGLTGTVTTRQVKIHYLKVTGLSASSGRPGESITIQGAGFDPTAGNMTVFFYPARQAAIGAVTPTSITVTVPNDVGTLIPGTDGITVVRKAKNGALVPAKKPQPFFPRRHEQILNQNTVNPDSVKTPAECAAIGGTMVGGFCIDWIAMHPSLSAVGGLGGIANAPAPTNQTSTPDPVAAHGGTATIDLDTGWFWAHYYYSADPNVPSGSPLLVALVAGDFTHIPVSAAGQFDVTTILDNRNPAPLLYLQSPADGTQTQQSTILVYGSVNASAVTIENLTIPVSYTVGTSVTYFQQQVQLAIGQNVIKVTATDAQNRTSTKQVTVTRIPLVTLKYRLRDLEPQTTGGGADPDPAKRNASGLNLSAGSLLITLNGNNVARSALVFKDNDLGSVAFDPDDLSTLRYDVTVEYKPGVNDLLNGQNTTTARCRDNAGNNMPNPVQATFNANY